MTLSQDLMDDDRCTDRQDDGPSANGVAATTSMPVEEATTKETKEQDGPAL